MAPVYRWPHVGHVFQPSWKPACWRAATSARHATWARPVSPLHPQPHWIGTGSSPPSRQMVQQGGSAHALRWPPSCQCLFWQAWPQYHARRHRLHLLRCPGSGLPHPAHAQNFREAAGGLVAAVLGSATPAPPAALSGGAVAVAVAPGGEVRGAVLLPPATSSPAAPPTRMCAGRDTALHPALALALATAVSTGAATHAEHFRALAGFFFWVLVNEPGGLSVLHAVHRMASA